MKVNRRHLLQIGIAQTLALTLPAQARSDVSSSKLKRRTGLSILQGATDEESVQLSILHERSQDLQFTVADQWGQRIQSLKLRFVQFKSHPMQITKIDVHNLQSGTTYFLIVEDRQEHQVIDHRAFQTLETNKVSLQFAILSCMKDANHSPEIWQNLVAKKPDILFFIGDAVYANEGTQGTATPAHLWNRFCEARQTLEIYYSPRLIPILATWDDHDFGMNDGHSKNYPYVLESQNNFLSFFAQDEGHCSRMIRGPGVSTAFCFGSTIFILTDGRSFRDEKGSKSRYAHWGKEQEEWLLQLLRRHHGAAFIMNGSQIFPQMIFKESMSGDHSVQFNSIMKEMQEMPCKVVFCSGDVHFSEISVIEKEVLGYQTYELTSSSVHSTNIPGILHLIKNPRRLVGVSERNYLMVNSVPTEEGYQLNVTSFGSKGESLFQKNLLV